MYFFLRYTLWVNSFMVLSLACPAPGPSEYQPRHEEGQERRERRKKEEGWEGWEEGARR
jgi:hypothetical protein